jgi:mono/diheme cytochrome c family protein
MAKRVRNIFLSMLFFAVAAPLLAQTLTASRGALLYETHCIACHDTHIHWRDRTLATDWASLSTQVRRWQANAGLNWTDDEINDVVRYLNAAIYRFPDQAPRQTG